MQKDEPWRKNVNAELSSRVQRVLVQNCGSFDLSVTVLQFLSMPFLAKMLRNIGSLSWTWEVFPLPVCGYQEVQRQAGIWRAPLQLCKLRQLFGTKSTWALRSSNSCQGISQIVESEALSHFLGEEFVFIASVRGVAIIVIIITDRNKCTEAAVLTQSVFLLFLHWYLLVWIEVCVFAFPLTNSISK